MVTEHLAGQPELKVVYCVFLGEPGHPYDLQYIATTDSGAREFAAKLRDFLSEHRPHHDSAQQEDWIQLSTGSHWLLRQTCQMMRVSQVELNKPRGQQPGDPPEIKLEVYKIMGWDK